MFKFKKQQSNSIESFDPKKASKDSMRRIHIYDVAGTAEIAMAVANIAVFEEAARKTADDSQRLIARAVGIGCSAVFTALGIYAFICRDKEIEFYRDLGELDGAIKVGQLIRQTAFDNIISQVPDPDTATEESSNKSAT